MCVRHKHIPKIMLIMHAGAFAGVADSIPNVLTEKELVLASTTHGEPTQPILDKIPHASVLTPCTLNITQREREWTLLKQQLWTYPAGFRLGFDWRATSMPAAIGAWSTGWLKHSSSPSPAPSNFLLGGGPSTFSLLPDASTSAAVVMAVIGKLSRPSPSSAGGLGCVSVKGRSTETSLFIRASGNELLRVHSNPTATEWNLWNTSRWPRTPLIMESPKRNYSMLRNIHQHKTMDKGDEGSRIISDK